MYHSEKKLSQILADCQPFKSQQEMFRLVGNALLEDNQSIEFAVNVIFKHGNANIASETAGINKAMDSLQSNLAMRDDQGAAIAFKHIVERMGKISEEMDLVMESMEVASANSHRIIGEIKSIRENFSPSPQALSSISAIEDKATLNTIKITNIYEPLKQIKKDIGKETGTLQWLLERMQDSQTRGREIERIGAGMRSVLIGEDSPVDISDRLKGVLEEVQRRLQGIDKEMTPRVRNSVKDIKLNTRPGFSQ